MDVTAAAFNAARSWTAHYGPGTPAEITVPDGSLYDLLKDAAERYASRPALVFFGRSMSYRALHDEVLRVATGLQRLGVKAGDRVALVMPNSPQHIVAFYAILRLGAIVVEHNPLYTKRELEVQFRDHGAEVAICWDKVASTVRSLAPELGIRHVVAVDITRGMPIATQLALRLPLKKARESREKLTRPAPGSLDFARLQHSTRLPESVPGPKNEDVALIQYTSGTTGVPKGAMITHRNLLANATQGAAWMPGLVPGRETIYAMLPMFHVFGMMLAVVYSMKLGASVVLFPTFDPQLVADASKKHPATFLPAVPPMLERIIRSAKDGKTDLSKVRYAISGAMALNAALVQRWDEVCDGQLVEGYGMTESSPVILGNPFSEDATPGMVGVPFPSTEMKIVDPDEGDREVELGERGELLVRGPQVFKGYWNRPEETAETLTEDGWLRTGDIVVEDERGFVKIVDRRKELIITGGYNVAPSEVEGAVNAIPGVKESAAVGVTRGLGDEVVTAVIVLEDGAIFDEKQAREMLREQLAEHKLPRTFVVWEELPKSLIGKTLRKKVRETLNGDKNATRVLDEEQPTGGEQPAATSETSGPAVGPEE
ncbi:Long-chain-fatty-acid--CoA ligase [Pseudoclavibacter triregionum]|nr:Long-chain-fatty-acid--CoA ligase [Pseudoclavibacter triregionum]